MNDIIFTSNVKTPLPANTMMLLKGPPTAIVYTSGNLTILPQRRIKLRHTFILYTLYILNSRHEPSFSEKKGDRR
ncbi:hypothetical protein E2C01_007060 [Portunus trituberculatus]|uniref:Uncharacterized protein n=1 Tax=Portunus trituberculatus TaxID=210409 RepID=A0A5B7CWU2_PORTR|nr:hypothetical protein [Portunus trituberculatus]